MFTHKLPLYCITPKRLLKDSVPSSQLFCNHNSLSTIAVLYNVKKKKLETRGKSLRLTYRPAIYRVFDTFI